MVKVAMGYDEELEEVSSEIMDPKCHHEKDTVHLYPTEEIHVKTYFLKRTNGMVNSEFSEHRLEINRNIRIIIKNFKI